MLGSLAAACARPAPAAAPTAAAPPLPAEREIKLAAMDDECNAMVAALEAYRTCTNLEDEDRQDLDSWLEATHRNLTAGRKAKPDANAQHAIAAACHRATASIQAAHQRCLAGPKPKIDD